MSKFTTEIAERICAGLTAGKSLRAVADEEGLSHSTILDWAEKNAVFGDQYARARKAGYLLLAEDLVPIADDKSGDSLRDRLRIDTRKWMLSKMLPKVYGDKAALEVSGPDGTPLIVTTGVPKPGGDVSDLV